jgi:hypothetical protein
VEELNGQVAEVVHGTSRALVGDFSPERLSPQYGEHLEDQQVGCGELKVPRGEKTAILALHGSGGAPLVILHGPRGRTIDATEMAPAIDATEMVLHAPSEDFTEVQIRGANAGAWTIEPAPGSPPISQASPPRPGFPAQITVRRARGSLLIGFRPASLASAQFVDVRLGDGRRLLFKLKGSRHSVSVPNVPAGDRVLTVEVRGFGFGALGPPARAQQRLLSKLDATRHRGRTG